MEQTPLEYTKEWRSTRGPWVLTSLSIQLPGTPFATIEETWSLVPGPAATNGAEQGTNGDQNQLMGPSNAPTKETVQLMGPSRVQQTGRATIHKRPAQKTSSPGKKPKLEKRPAQKTNLPSNKPKLHTRPAQKTSSASKKAKVNERPAQQT